MSAASVAGPKQQENKADRDSAYHGSHAGRLDGFAEKPSARGYTLTEPTAPAPMHVTGGVDSGLAELDDVLKAHARHRARPSRSTSR